MATTVTIKSDCGKDQQVQITVITNGVPDQYCMARGRVEEKVIGEGARLIVREIPYDKASSTTAVSASIPAQVSETTAELEEPEVPGWDELDDDDDLEED